MGLMIGNKGNYALVDTGSTLIAGPYFEIKKLNEKLGSVEVENGEFLFDCTTIDSLPSK